MFTGLVMCTGEVTALRRSASDAYLTIRPEHMFTDPERGESIAVNGACLTAETFSSGTFTAFASAQTLGLTTLGSLSPGSTVNLERALTLSSRLGGHMVSGHVDCVAEVINMAARDGSLVFRLRYPAVYRGQVIAKGSVALDGISLTINDCGDDFFEVNIIPETRSTTTIRLWKPGHKVNMETDIIGKYVERFLSCKSGTAEAAGKRFELDMDFLRRNGF